jgi:hypothetical protein
LEESRIKEVLPLFVFMEARNRSESERGGPFPRPNSGPDHTNRAEADRGDLKETHLGEVQLVGVEVVHVHRYTSSSVSLSRFPQLPLMRLRELAPPDDQTALTYDSLSGAEIVALPRARSPPTSRRHSRAARSPELDAVPHPRSPPKIKLQFRATRSPTTRSTPTSSRSARAHQPPPPMESPEKPYLI